MGLLSFFCTRDLHFSFMSQQSSTVSAPHARCSPIHPRLTSASPGPGSRVQKQIDCISITIMLPQAHTSYASRFTTLGYNRVSQKFPQISVHVVGHPMHVDLRFLEFLPGFSHTLQLFRSIAFGSVMRSLPFLFGAG